MEAKVYGVPGSHPTKAAMLMLDHKGIEARRTDLPNVLCRPLLRAMGFPGATVPAVKVDGRRLQTTRAISRGLDELVATPPLFPADPELRAKVEDAERWGDEVLQEIPRRIAFSSPVRRKRSELASFFERRVLGLPPRAAMATAPPLMAANARLRNATDEAVRNDLAGLSTTLDRVDALIEEGVIGGRQRNAADFQIATSVRLLMCFDDIRPAVDGRPAATLAREVVPDFPGRVGPALPEEWLAPLRSATP